MSPYMSAFLLKVGYNRNMPRAVVFGPRKYGGAGYARGYPSQCTTALHDLVRHIRVGDDCKKQALICLSFLQLIVGVEWDIMQHPNLPLQYLPKCWLVMLRDFLGKIDGSLLLQEACPPPAAEGDCLLMGGFIQCGATKAKLLTLNCCRLYLQAIMLANIATPGGARIEGWAMCGLQRVCSRLKWPRQGKPNKQAWRCWRRFLKRAFSRRAPRRHRVSQPLMLDARLGRWARTESHCEWEVVYDAANCEL